MRPMKSSSPAGSSDRRISNLLDTIAEEMDLIRGDEDRVTICCNRFRDLVEHPPSAPDMDHLKKLASFYSNHEGTVSGPVFTLLADISAEMKRPWPLLEIMLGAEDEELQRQALELTCQLIDAGLILVTDDVLETLGCILSIEEGLAADAGTTRCLAKSLRGYFKKRSRRQGDPLVALIFREKRISVRMFLARLLDGEGARVSAASSRLLLGPVTYTLLKPYLDYTGAGYVDHLAIRGTDLGATVSASLEKAAGEFGEKAVRDVLAQVGWEHANLGMRFQRFVKIEVSGSLPLMVSPQQALLFMDMREAVVGDSCVVAVAQGFSVSMEEHGTGDDDPIGRFRSLNIVHAELLGEIMDLAPLGRAKVVRILGHMDRIVEDYGILFGAVSKEVRILPNVYETLKRRVLEELEKDEDGFGVNAEATRLLQMFEDPGNLGEVRTIHGLKRYLHQEGLRLGLELVDTSRSPSHSVDIFLSEAGGETTLIQSICYAEFETVAERNSEPWLIYPIRIVVEGFTRQLLYGQRTFPDINAFVFGNEVHYYIAFRNHPAFLRIDYSPPQRGGMIDLQYLGVSNYELNVHPGSDLEAIQLFFRELGFDVKLDGTRVLVRYDKETSPDLGDLSAKAESLFRLVPHLMSVDWTVGSLVLDEEGKRRAAEHWAERFVCSGVLPIADILTEDRGYVIRDTFAGPSGQSVATWDGTSPYADIYSAPYPTVLLENLTARLAGFGIRVSDPVCGEDGKIPGLLGIQRTLLAPLQESLISGRVVVAKDGLGSVDSDLFAAEHPAEHFAGLLARGGSAAVQAIALAGPISVLDRFAPFETVGFVGGMDIQRAKVEIRGGTLVIYAARDGHGVVRMGLYTKGREITRARCVKGTRWHYDTEADGRLWSLLLGANYVGGVPDPVRENTVETLEELRHLALQQAPAASLAPRDERRLLRGLSASPGRAMGRAVFETAGRDPEHLDGGILVAREIRPTDASHLLHAIGIVSAGGAVLSHAALLALQFGKPALVTDADFHRTKGKGRSLRFVTPIYEVEVRRRQGFDVGLKQVAEYRSDVIHEGDLLVLDADAGVVQVFGQGRDALALYEGFRMLDDASRKDQAVREAEDVMVARGLKLRARHILEKALDRLHDPVLGIFAVEEISLGRSFTHVANTDRVHLMSRLFENKSVGGVARERLIGITRILAERFEAAVTGARNAMATSFGCSEILGLRLKVIHANEALVVANDVLAGCGIDPRNVPDPRQVEKVGAVARKRLIALRERTIDELLAPKGGQGTSIERRHLLNRIDRFDLVLGGPSSRRRHILARKKTLKHGDEKVLARASANHVLASDSCGYELHGLIGWKAANLAELARLVGEGVVPPWFVVNNQALSRMLRQKIDTQDSSMTLGNGIREILGREGLDLARKSALIRDLWTAVAIPDAVVDEINAAYDHLDDGGQGADVALRSSSCDEDTETTTRAGEYDTFLHVRGRESVCRYLKLTWAGLWTARALSSREAAGDIMRRPTGGVIVQVMVPARASGVMQTVNVPADDYREVVINAGLGLGEGVVSGLVATDMITVVKNDDPGDRSLRINYITNDKTTQVVLDKRRGGGTRLGSTLYHQRLRPALEYLELVDLVSKALRLEGVYGYPLDLEFAVEGLNVWLLQARPIGVHAGDLRETLDHYPLSG